MRRSVFKILLLLSIQLLVVSVNIQAINDSTTEVVNSTASISKEMATKETTKTSAVLSADTTGSSSTTPETATKATTKTSAVSSTDSTGTSTTEDSSSTTTGKPDEDISGLFNTVIKNIESKIPFIKTPGGIAAVVVPTVVVVLGLAVGIPVIVCLKIKKAVAVASAATQPPA